MMTIFDDGDDKDTDDNDDDDSDVDNDHGEGDHDDDDDDNDDDYSDDFKVWSSFHLGHSCVVCIAMLFWIVLYSTT